MSDNSTNPPADPSAQTGALGITQQSLLAFQRMQEQTANLHKQFLDNQQAALATLQALVAQQQALLTGQPVPAATPVPAPVALPAPMPVVPPAPPPVDRPAPQPAPLPVPTAAVKAAPAPKPAAPARDASGTLLSVVAEKTG